jgi:O-antigen/teichoic acid export membrane protein
MATTRSSPQRSSSSRLGREDDDVRAAIRFAVLASVTGVGFLVIAAIWVSTCGATDIDTAACGVPQRTLLGLGAPAILLGGAVWAFVRTYRTWRDDRTWWGWQGAGWFLMTLMLLALTTGFPTLAGPALG